LAAMDAAGGSQAGDSSELSSPSSSGGGEQVYVAVGGSKAMVLWALHKFPKDTAFVLLHVCSQPKLIPIMGARIPARQVQEQELTSYKKMELQRINDSLDQHLLLCAQEKVQAEKLVVESDDVAEGLVQLITEHHVTALVMGAAADKHYTKKMKALKSKKAQVVEQRADPSCKIWYICKGTLVYRRKAVPLSHGARPQGTQKPGAQQFSVDRSTSLSEMWCVSNTWLHKPNLRRSDANEKETVHEFDEGDNKFQHMLRELESVRKQAYEDNCSREKAERELFEAFQKVIS
uniref:RING-type E3 ubiquitin transferase n=1 Tax=Aegilops tauschii subsp. strangulata TaxID=200361 RepID=A0A453PSC6_AEGTS